jgi:PAS domain-containing protein
VVPPSTGLSVPAATLSDRFLELTTDIAGAFGFDGRIVGANPALTGLIGAQIGDLGGANADAYLHPAERAMLGERWIELVSGRRDSAELEIRLGAVGGEPHWFLLSLVVDRDAALVYLIGKDVHESRRAAARLGDAEARFRSAFETSAIGITITGLDARYIRVNAAFARMLGRSA